MDFLSGLNPQQEEAVSYVTGPMLVLAGAGSGKTRVITHRICHLISSCGLPGQGILAVTFTNKAADEMRQRVMGKLAGLKTFGSPLISTFHSFCVRLLRRDGARLADFRRGFTPEFLIYDDDDQVALLKSVYRQMGLDEKFMQHRVALSRISRAKNRQADPNDMHREAADPKSRQLAAVFEEYEGRLRRANALDFDDLLLEAVRLLRHDEATRRAYQERIHHLMVDEYQDTNRSQYELMLLLGARHRNVCAVGDEDQSIYGWRGADIRNILDFERDYPDAKVVRLEQNYRSTSNILKGAGAVVGRNRQRKGKNLWTEAGSGEPIGIYEALDAENEADFIAETIERLIAADPSTRIAVLYRTNFQSRQIEEALRRRGRKYLVVGGFSFYQRAEVKDILAYLKLLLNQQDTVSLLRVINTPARGIGRTTVEQLENFARVRNRGLWDAIRLILAENLLSSRAASALKGFRLLVEELRELVQAASPGELVQAVVDRTGYRRMLSGDGSPGAESRLENLEELINAAEEAAERGETLAGFLDHAALVSESDDLDERAQVSLLTAHNAKGLEFPVVFVAGLEDGLLPHARSVQSESGIEEERRLCYVAMTRAERQLVLTWARSRRKFGGGPLEPSIPSRFLAEVPAEYTQSLGKPWHARGPELFAEQYEVREAVKRTTYTGKTYNSLENIAQFFSERGLPAPGQTTASGAPPQAAPAPARQPVPAARKTPKGLRAGVTVHHPRYGQGVVVRKEGEGEDAKLTVSFSRHGLKKLVAKYAGLKAQEE